MNVVAVIKASSISNYFPERYKLTIGGLPLLEFIINRIRKSKLINDIVLSTTRDTGDDQLVSTAKRLDCKIYQGSYEDSIGRLYEAASVGKADIVVKIMGHYPLIEPWECDKTIEKFIASDYTYAYNEHYDGIVLGLGVDVFTYELIEKANREIASPVKRRIGTNIFKDIVDKSKILAPKYQFHRPNYRVTLAVPKDEIILNQIINECEDLSYPGIVQYLDKNPIVVKYAQQNLSVSQEVGLEKILLFPDKIKAIQNCLNSEVDFSFPASVELSLTNRCNLSCKWCSDSALRKRSMVDIDFDILEKLFRNLAENGTRGVVLEGGGEPTIYPRFNDVVKCLKDYGLSLGLITNGVELSYEDNLSCFDWIRVSLDAANKHQFLAGKGRDLFDVVISNIQRITQKKNVNNLIVGISYIVTNFNEENLEELVLNLHKIDVDYIQIKPVIDYPDMLPKNLEIDYLQKYSTAEFSINIHNMSENIIKGNFNIPCRTHSLSSVITADGSVFLCGRLNIYDWIKPIGNLHEKSFHEIWHGNERIQQSKMVLDSEFCRKWCPECRLTKYNIVFTNASGIKTRNFI